MMKYDSPINYYFNNYILRENIRHGRIYRYEKPQVPASVFTGLRRNQKLHRKNHLLPGDKLPSEMKMCEMLGVSRNVLREAIKSLEITGAVHSTPGVGIVIQVI